MYLLLYSHPSRARQTAHARIPWLIQEISRR
jgi:hypothetical protein